MTIAELKGQIAQLEERKQRTHETYHQVSGALQFARIMLEKMEVEANKNAPAIPSQ